MISLCILSCSAAIVQAEDSQSVLSTNELKEIATQIKAAEKILLNIKVESEAWMEEKLSPSKPWQQTPIYVSSTAWLDGLADSKARVDVHQEILEWRNGIAPYLEKSSSYGFDGQYGRVVNHTQEWNGEKTFLKTGEILPEPPKRLKTGWLRRCTGIHFSLHFFRNEIYKFSELFQLASDPNSEAASILEFSHEEFLGVDCIKINSETYHKSYWLDPSRGFALLGNKETGTYEDGSERIASFVKVNKLKKVASGLWWPMEISIESDPAKHGEPYKRFVYRASNVIANDPNFDENIFTVILPDGYLIDDKVAGKKFTVGQ
jgi:hypothetical protein